MFIDTARTAGRHFADGVAVQTRNLFGSKNLPPLGGPICRCTNRFSARLLGMPAKWTDTSGDDSGSPAAREEGKGGGVTRCDLKNHAIALQGPGWWTGWLRLLTLQL